jgi:alpha/beta superfamily hydrolase
MPRRIESLLLNGPGGKLEALLEEPEDSEPQQAVLVCHPHPLHGGTMHNKVVYRIARAMRRSGAVVLRFNYRGVNLSEGKYDDGIGEIDDARAALAFLRGRCPDLPYSLAGFSFGSRIALKLGCEPAGAARVYAAGFPARYQDEVDLRTCRTPRIYLLSTNDEFCPVAAMEAYFDTLPPPKKLVLVEAADHFFAGALDQFEAALLKEINCH